MIVLYIQISSDDVMCGYFCFRYKIWSAVLTNITASVCNSISLILSVCGVISLLCIAESSIISSSLFRFRFTLRIMMANSNEFRTTIGAPLDHWKDPPLLSPNVPRIGEDITIIGNWQLWVWMVAGYQCTMRIVIKLRYVCRFPGKPLGPLQWTGSVLFMPLPPGC